MKRIVMVEEEGMHVAEVKTVWSDEEATQFISEGWVLIHGGVAHKDNMGYQAKPVFILGKMKEGKQNG